MNDHDRGHCLQLADRLSEYLDGELSEELTKEVQAHFEGCSNCERFLLSLKRIKNLGIQLSGPELPVEKLRELGRRALSSEEG